MGCHQLAGLLVTAWLLCLTAHVAQVVAQAKAAQAPFKQERRQAPWVGQSATDAGEGVEARWAAALQGALDQHRSRSAGLQNVIVPDAEALRTRVATQGHIHGRSLVPATFPVQNASGGVDICGGTCSAIDNFPPSLTFQGTPYNCNFSDPATQYCLLDVRKLEYPLGRVEFAISATSSPVDNYFGVGFINNDGLIDIGQGTDGISVGYNTLGTGDTSGPCGKQWPFATGCTSTGKVCCGNFFVDFTGTDCSSRNITMFVFTNNDVGTWEGLIISKTDPNCIPGGTPATPTPTPTTPAGTPTTPSPSGKTKSGTKTVIFATATAVGGAILAGIIGLFFFCCRRRLDSGYARKQHNFADNLRQALRLRTVDNFQVEPGLLWLHSVEKLQEVLERRGLIKPVQLIAPEHKPGFVDTVASVLSQRYGLGTTAPSMSEREFLTRFAHDILDPTVSAQIASDVEEAVSEKRILSRGIFLPQQAAAMGVPVMGSAPAVAYSVAATGAAYDGPPAKIAV